MDSRIEKYDKEEVIPSRTKKNQALYREMSEEELDSFDANSNTSILDGNTNTIDVDKLRDMLDRKYRVPERKRPTFDEVEPLDNRDIDLNETREYDINELLNEAKANSKDDYEVERLRKLKNTNIDILNDLNIEHEKEVEEEPLEKKPAEKKLMELIDTINLKETKGDIEETSTDIDPLDILTDLKGDNDATKVLGAKEREIIITKEAPNIKDLSRTTEIDKKELLKEKEEKQYLTTTNMFTESDFDDFNDLKEEVASTKVIMKLLIFLVVVVFIVGVVFLVNKYFNLGLF